MKNFFLLLTLLCLSLSARAHDAEVDGIFYNLDTANKTATVTYDGESKNKYFGVVVIPEAVTYNGIAYSVTGLGNYCFYYCNNLTSITIPNSVTSLGQLCFFGCSSLTSITIPNSVTSLGVDCFWGCSNLTSITIPNSVTSLGNLCFYCCRSLTSITIPSSVTSLGDGCFSGCSSLTSITIPNSVKNLGEWCFLGCRSLSSIYMLPSTPPSTGDSGFYDIPLEAVVYVVDKNAKTAYQAKKPWNAFQIVVK